MTELTDSKTHAEVLEVLYLKIKRNQNDSDDKVDQFYFEPLVKKIDQFLNNPDEKCLIPNIILLAMQGSLYFEYGKRLMFHEKTEAGLLAFKTTLRILKDHESHPHITYLYLRTVNQMGFYLCKMEQLDEAKDILEKGQSIYEKIDQKDDILLYCTDDLFQNHYLDKNKNALKLERLITHNFQTQAWIYNRMGLSFKFLMYHHMVLRRQLEMKDGTAFSWFHKCIRLAAFFFGSHSFPEARHQLSAACTVIREYEIRLLSRRSEPQFVANWNNLRRLYSEIGRYWIKYAIFLLDASRRGILQNKSDAFNTTFKRQTHCVPGENIFQKRSLTTFLENANNKNEASDEKMTTMEESNKSMLNEVAETISLLDNRKKEIEVNLDQDATAKETKSPKSESKSDLVDGKTLESVQSKEETITDDTKMESTFEDKTEMTKTYSLVTEMDVDRFFGVSHKGMKSERFFQNQNNSSDINIPSLTSNGEQPSLTDEIIEKEKENNTKIDNNEKEKENKTEIKEQENEIETNETKNKNFDNPKFQTSPNDAESEGSSNNNYDPPYDFKFPSLDVEFFEKQVTAEPIYFPDQAKDLFNFLQGWMKNVKAFYTIEDYPMEFIEIHLDMSDIYQYLTLIETDLDTQYELQRNRIEILEMLSMTLKLKRPQFALFISIELLHEITQAQVELLTLNVRRISNSQRPPILMSEICSDNSDDAKRKLEALLDIRKRLGQSNIAENGSLFAGMDMSQFQFV